MNCAAKTVKGEPCKFKGKNGGLYCKRHTKTMALQAAEDSPTATGEPFQPEVSIDVPEVEEDVSLIPSAASDEVSVTEKEEAEEYTLEEEETPSQATCVYRGRGKVVCGLPCEDTGKLSFCSKHRKASSSQDRIDRLAEHEALEVQEVEEVSVTPIGNNRFRGDDGMVYLTNGRFVLM